MTNNIDRHIDIFKDRYDYYSGNQTKETFKQGFQSESAKLRYNNIIEAYDDNYLETRFLDIHNTNFDSLSDEVKSTLKNLVDGVTSEVGRALVGLTFLQLTIKSIEPDQSIRLHKGSNRKNTFSWEEGISMRTLDRNYSTPFLREKGLLNLNKDGLFMTRSLSENYPYTELYKAEMRGPFAEWLIIVDFIEKNSSKAQLALDFLMILLLNRSESFKELANETCKKVESLKGKDFNEYKGFLKDFFTETDYSARAFEVVIHSLYQALSECGKLGESQLQPMTQMRSANKKHGNVGDVELIENGEIIESWDAKFGKPYLRDELEELREKLLANPTVKVAGFIVNLNPELRDVQNRKESIEQELGVSLYFYSFDSWVNYVMSSIDDEEKNDIGYAWLEAVVQTFSRKRLDYAPIDEPCDNWLMDLSSRLDIEGKAL